MNHIEAFLVQCPAPIQPFIHLLMSGVMTLILNLACSSSFVSFCLHLHIVGTSAYAPPEYFTRGAYEAAPTTVWQLGALLYELLDGYNQFITSEFLHKNITFNTGLSQGKSMMASTQHLNFGTNIVQSVPSVFQQITAASILILTLFSVLFLVRLPGFVKHVFGFKPQGARHSGANATAPLVLIMLHFTLFFFNYFE